MLVAVAQLMLAGSLALPRLDFRHYPGQQPQPIVGWQNRQSEHVAEYAKQEQPLHRMAHFLRLLYELIGSHAVYEFAQHPQPSTGFRRAIVASTMTGIIAVTAVAIVAWFAAGTIWNVRRGRLLMHWMQSGLPVLGEHTTVRWLGSSAIEMVIRDGKVPFASVTLVVFLEPRDTPWMWALGRARGRRDTLIIRGVLPRDPSVELEALDAKSWSGREALRRVPAAWLARQAPAPDGLVVHYASAAALERADALLAEARRNGLIVKRLSLRHVEPHFQIHVSLPDEEQPARAFFDAVHAIAERALD